MEEIPHQCWTKAITAEHDDVRRSFNWVTAGVRGFASPATPSCVATGRSRTMIFKRQSYFRSLGCSFRDMFSACRQRAELTSLVSTGDAFGREICLSHCGVREDASNTLPLVS